MSDPDIAPEILDLLRAHIHTYEALHVLLLLRREGGELNVEDVANELQLSQLESRQVLSELVAAELVAQDQPGWFRYRPRLSTARVPVDRLARLFDEDPLRIVHWMSRNAFAHLQQYAAGAFAEAVMTAKKKRE